MGTFKLIPRTLALSAVQRQAATSKSANPSSKGQHLSPEGGEPKLILTNPRRSAQTPNFNVSVGHKGFTGGAFGVGFGRLHEPQALENVASKRREQMKRGVEAHFLKAMDINKEENS
ncbi:hypothetical protein Leryth_014733 [Lithospermum erythrorhizon]|nr:hypothetical protein Leryth_014733 [Lithospermum erythrorhizon]